VCTHWSDGGAGAEALARHVVELSDSGKAAFKPLYSDDLPLRDKVRTIADSLGAPHAAPYSFGLCRTYVDDLAKVSDDQIRAAMLLLFRSAKLAVEPAGAAATAALCGPLRERLQGKRVALIVCGANIDRETFCGHLAAAERAG